VAGFKEQQEFPEFIDHSTFGSAVHNTLETLYMPYLGKLLSEDALNAMVPRVRTELERQFTEVLSLDESPEGRNLLALEVAVTYVQRVIQHDVETIRSGNAITLLKMEEELKAPMPFNGSEVLLKGMADRIDRLGDGTVRIIDYKTGARSTKKAITHPEDLAKSGFLGITTTNAQCPGCVIDAQCGVGINPIAPTLCPAALPNGTQGQPYDQNLTFFMPRDFYRCRLGSGGYAQLYYGDPNYGNAARACVRMQQPRMCLHGDQRPTDTTRLCENLRNTVGTWQLQCIGFCGGQCEYAHWRYQSA
jgi:hypothetical protein